jgi:hypothetical protein
VAAESQTKSTETWVVSTELHTLTPTGKSWGPVDGLLLSRPIISQVIGVTESEVLVAACAGIGMNIAAIKGIIIFRPRVTASVNRLKDTEDINKSKQLAASKATAIAT